MSFPIKKQGVDKQGRTYQLESVRTEKGEIIATIFYTEEKKRAEVYFYYRNGFKFKNIVYI